MAVYVINYYSCSNTGAHNWGINCDILKTVVERKTITEDELKEIIQAHEDCNCGFVYDERKNAFINKHLYKGASYGYQEISFVEVDEHEHINYVLEQLRSFVKKKKTVYLYANNRTEELLESVLDKIIDEDLPDIIENEIKIDGKDLTFVSKVDENNFQDIENFILEIIENNDLSEYAGLYESGIPCDVYIPYRNGEEGWYYEINDYFAAFTWQTVEQMNAAFFEFTYCFYLVTEDYLACNA